MHYFTWKLYFVNDCRFNDVYSRNYLPRIKDGAHVLNLDEKQGKETHWLSLFMERNTVVYFDTFQIECSPSKKTKTKKTLHKKRSFQLRISSVNVTKSRVSCRFGYIHWRNH